MTTVGIFTCQKKHARYADHVLVTVQWQDIRSKTLQSLNNLGHFLKTAEQVFFGVSGGAKFHLHFHGFSGNTLTRFFPSSTPQKMEMESARTTLHSARKNPTLGRAKSFTADEFGIRKHPPGPKPSPNLKAIQKPCEKWYLNSWSL